MAPNLKMLRKVFHRFFRHRALQPPFLREEGYCWMAPTPELTHIADSLDAPQRSTLLVYENGIPLLRAHVSHHLIRSEGNGLFSHWRDTVYFSTSDNSDPNSNGRIYSYTISAKIYQTFGRAWADCRPVNYSQRDTSPEAISKDAVYALQVGFNMMAWLRDLQPLRDKTVLEIGPGTNFGPILVLACHGAVPIVADRFLAPWDPSYHPHFYREFRAELVREHLEVDPRPIDDLIEAGAYPEHVLRRVSTGAESLDLPSNSIDIILSNAVIEHLEDHPKAFSEFYRVTKPGGWGAHQIDFRDHRSFDRPLEHLLLSPRQFERIAHSCFRECGTYLRSFEMIKLFQDCGFESKEFTPNLFASPDYLEDLLPRLRKARRSLYRRASEEHLRALSGLFIVRKP